ncbi:hypothetical protein HAP94_01570 [Acidithiobacillus ferrivorans]|nr:hypothetical protein [Acidithiobacillus ferrivorans]
MTSWTVEVHFTHGIKHVLSSGKGDAHEWISLDRLDHWLRGLGFHEWCLRSMAEPDSLQGVNDER